MCVTTLFVLQRAYSENAFFLDNTIIALFSLQRICIRVARSWAALTPYFSHLSYSTVLYYSITVFVVHYYTLYVLLLYVISLYLVYLVSCPSFASPRTGTAVGHTC